MIFYVSVYKNGFSNSGDGDIVHVGQFVCSLDKLFDYIKSNPHLIYKIVQVPVLEVPDLDLLENE